MAAEEVQNRKIRYPKSVFFIISNEFCERFSYYGMKTVLSLYLTNSLNYDTNTSTILYHIFAMLCYFFPLFGAILADSFLGKFKTIFYLSIIYALGNIVLSIGAIPVLAIPHRTISLLGLLFIAIGTGGIKPCVSAFGGDQFVLPEQSLQLQRFFSFFYFSINAGSMISTFLTPALRNDVKCFGQNSCFPLAFGVPAILMIVSVVIFVLGKNLYKMKRPEENIIIVFISCIWQAVKNKLTSKNSEKKEHWLEYAQDKFSKQQISDIQAVLNVLYLFIPVPLFWALFDQQGSRWTFQATNMDGRIFGYTLKPDQMQVVNPLMILFFIPIFELYIYPALKTVGIKRPLQKLVIGAFLAAFSFVVSAFVEYNVQSSYGVMSVANEGQIRIFNTLNCNVVINPSIENVTSIESLSALELLHIPVKNSKKFDVVFSIDEKCPYSLNNVNGIINVDENKVIEIFYSSASDSILDVNLRNVNNPNQNSIDFKKIRNNTETDFILIPPGTYDLISNSVVIKKNIVFNPGEVDIILIHRTNSSNFESNLINLMPSNKVHMLWQLPQIIIITAGEIMFSITGLEFSFTQAPPSMKSVLSAAWLLTVAFGNLIVVIVSEIKFFNSQVYEFLLFAGLMVLDVLCLIVLCLKYKYVNFENNSENGNIDIKQNGKELSSSQATDVSALTQ
ncbi:hypothetical protein PGB90_006696 [Kerria lacca]